MRNRGGEWNLLVPDGVAPFKAIDDSNGSDFDSMAGSIEAALSTARSTAQDNATMAAAANVTAMLASGALVSKAGANTITTTLVDSMLADGRLISREDATDLMPNGLAEAAQQAQQVAEQAATDAATAQAAAEDAAASAHISTAPADDAVAGLAQQTTSATRAALDGLFAGVPRTGGRAIGTGELTRSVKDYGAIGDGTSRKVSTVYPTLAAAQAVWPCVKNIAFDEVDWAAMQTCISDGAGSVLIPAGHYVISDELKQSSHTLVRGHSQDATYIQFCAGASFWSNGFTNASNDRLERTNADTCMALSDLTIDGRAISGTWDRNDGPNGGDPAENPFGITKNGKNGYLLTNTSSCGVGWSCVTNSTIDRVRSIGHGIHCISIDASQYDETHVTADGSTTAIYVQPGPSQDVTVRDCLVDFHRKGADDPFTCHWSDRVTFERCKAVNGSAPTATPPTSDANQSQQGCQTSNGFEIDEGSRDCKVIDCYSYGWAAGFQSKGHATSRPATGTVFDRCIAEACSLPFDVTWPIMQANVYPAVKEPIARDVTVRDCEARNHRQNYYTGDPATDFHELYSLSIAGYSGVKVTNFTIRNAPKGGQIRYDITPGLSIDGLTVQNAWNTTPATTTATQFLINPNRTGETNPLFTSDVKIRNVIVRDGYPPMLGSLLRAYDGLPRIVVDNIKGNGTGSSCVTVDRPLTGGGITNVTGTGYTVDVAVSGQSGGFGEGNYAQNYIPGAANTPWDAITLTSGWTGTIQAARDGRTVCVTVTNVVAPAGSSGTVTVGTLPKKYWPGAQVSGALLASGSTFDGYRWIDAAGRIRGPFTAGVMYSGTFTYLV